MEDQICNRKMEAESALETSFVFVISQTIDNV